MARAARRFVDSDEGDRGAAAASILGDFERDVRGVLSGCEAEVIARPVGGPAVVLSTGRAFWRSATGALSRLSGLGLAGIAGCRCSGTGCGQDDASLLRTPIQGGQLGTAACGAVPV